MDFHNVYNLPGLVSSQTSLKWRAGGGGGGGGRGVGRGRGGFQNLKKKSKFSGNSWNKNFAAGRGTITKVAASGARQSWAPGTSSQLYLFENTFLSWECRLCPQQGLTDSPVKPFFSFWGFAASLPFVTQFPTKIITLWLLCPFMRGSQNRTLHWVGTGGQRDCVS